MKTAMQKLIHFLESEENIHYQIGDYAAGGAYEMAKVEAQKIMLSDEKQQITDAFDKGKSRAYATTDGECEVKFGFQFYNETYTENEHK